MYHTIIPVFTGQFTIKFGRTDNPDMPNIPSFVFIIVDDKGKPVLVDTGFHRSFIPGIYSSYREADQTLDMALTELGFNPEKIDTVIQTHLHWDHTGGMSLFPHASFYVQAEELKALLNLNINEECSFCPGHWLSLMSRFRLVNGDIEIKPGLNIIFTGNHTPGHQVVAVKTRSGTVVLGGDMPYVYDFLWNIFSEEQWQAFRNGPGKKLYWNKNVRTRIQKYLEMQEAFELDKPTAPPVENVKKMGDHFITTHNPKLMKIKSFPG